MKAILFAWVAHVYCETERRRSGSDRRRIDGSISEIDEHPLTHPEGITFEPMERTAVAMALMLAAKMTAESLFRHAAQARETRLKQRRSCTQKQVAIATRFFTGPPAF